MLSYLFVISEIKSKGNIMQNPLTIIKSCGKPRPTQVARGMDRTRLVMTEKTHPVLAY